MKFESYLAGVAPQKGKSIFDHRPHGVRDLDKKPAEKVKEADRKPDDHEKKQK